MFSNTKTLPARLGTNIIPLQKFKRTHRNANKTSRPNDTVQKQFRRVLFFGGKQYLDFLLSVHAGTNLRTFSQHLCAANNARRVTCIAKRFYCLMPQLAANSAQMKETDQVADDGIVGR